VLQTANGKSRALLIQIKKIYDISDDTKLLSKILEIHLYPKFLEFADKNNYNIVLPDKQNYYPDLSFVDKNDENNKFALDLKTTYRLEKKPDFIRGFTLGSHGEYFINRNSDKNIQFPYNKYKGHFCLGIIYTRLNKKKFPEIYRIKDLKRIISAIGEFQFFACDKWAIASDKGGSGNTANIGSIKYIPDIIEGNGLFKNLGEECFDDYWINYGKIIDIQTNKPITSLEKFLAYKGKDVSLINYGTFKKKRY
jgi:hypothetical protein